MDKLTFVVRSGLGTFRDWTQERPEFADEITRAARVPQQHAGWLAVTYHGKRYQLFGGCYVDHFICLNSPIKGRR